MNYISRVYSGKSQCNIVVIYINLTNYYKKLSHTNKIYYLFFYITKSLK